MYLSKSNLCAIFAAAFISGCNQPGIKFRDAERYELTEDGFHFLMFRMEGEAYAIRTSTINLNQRETAKRTLFFVLNRELGCLSGVSIEGDSVAATAECL